MKAEIRQGDCIEVMRELEESSIDAVVCDPPYGLEFMGKEWDSLAGDWRTDPGRGEHAASSGRPSGKRGFDGHPPTPRYHAGKTAQDWHHAWATEALRVLKPGGHLLAFGGTRTYHRLACAVEDAGFEIRDSVVWMYGSGFPKSLDVSKAIDKAERGVPQGGMDPTSVNHGRYRTQATEGKRDEGDSGRGYGAGPGQFMAEPGERVERELVSEAEQWQGWGTALKPAHEPIVVARKPLVGTVAQSVQEHGTGALNVDGCRVDTEDNLGGGAYAENPSEATDGWRGGHRGEQDKNSYRRGGAGEYEQPSGRWPPNVALSHTEDCRAIGARRVRSGNSNRGVVHGTGEGTTYLGQKESGAHYADSDGLETVERWECAEGCPIRLLDEQTGGLRTNPGTARSDHEAGLFGITSREGKVLSEGDSGGASRFFYVAKASRSERNAGLEGFEEKPAGVLQARAQEEGTYLEFVHSAPEGIGEWLQEAREAAGLSLKAVAAHFPSRTGGITGCVTNWEREFNRPTPEQWRKLREVLGFDARYDEVMTTTRPVDRELFDGRERVRSVNSHPTVKPLTLMRWLVRLVTPPGGLILDPFTGSGTTGVAAVLEGFDFVGIEREAEYVEIAKARIAHWAAQPEQLGLEAA